MKILCLGGGPAGLYFAISMMTDDLYRREFLDRITDEMKETFARRSEYLALRDRSN
jgi:2-polyprenyl-6-methoxyphenol hydroxylase-like FAD-dependent oxidoreductase